MWIVRDAERIDQNVVSERISNHLRTVIIFGLLLAKQSGLRRRLSTPFLHPNLLLTMTGTQKWKF